MAKVTSYIHGHFFKLAEKAYKKAIKDSEESLASIILSTMAFEAFLNEFENIIKTHEGEGKSEQLLSLKRILDDLEDERTSIILKTQIIYYFLTHKLLDKGTPPFQDYCFLIKIRNVLIHKNPRKEKVEWEPQDTEKEYEPHKFVKFLSDRRIIKKPHKNNPPFWYQNVIQPEVAKWAHNTCIQMVKLIGQNIPDRKISQLIHHLILKPLKDI